MQCSLCPRPILPSELEEAYTQQTVWVHGPKKNGATLAEDTGERAHKECVEQAVAGILPGTPSLFDEEGK